jgi:hypothetical protein
VTSLFFHGVSDISELADMPTFVLPTDASKRCLPEVLKVLSHLTVIPTGFTGTFEKGLCMGLDGSKIMFSASLKVKTVG